MRRGRFFGAAFVAALAFSGSALAATGQPNASVQGYGGVQVITIKPTTSGVAGTQHTVTHVTCAELAARGDTQSATYKQMCSSCAEQSASSQNGSTAQGGVAGASTSHNCGTLAATHTAGQLPFTGLQLTIAVALGAALLAGGFLLRRVAREGSPS